MKRFLTILCLSLFAVSGLQAQYSHITETGKGLQIGLNSINPIGFNGAVPTPQRSGIAEAALALTSATGSVTFSGSAVANDTVQVGSITYTFAASVSSTAHNLVLVGGSTSAASNLVAAINATPALAGIAFSPPTVSNTTASATASANIVNLTALLGGTAGNALAIAKSGSNIAVTSGSTGFLSGGVQFSDVNAAANLLNEIRAALVQKGLIKGSP